MWEECGEECGEECVGGMCGRNVIEVMWEECDWECGRNVMGECDGGMWKESESYD
jgi:hypothetical protein